MSLSSEIPDYIQIDIKPGSIITLEDEIYVYFRSIKEDENEVPIFIRHKLKPGSVDVDIVSGSVCDIIPALPYHENVFKYDDIYQKIEKVLEDKILEEFSEQDKFYDVSFVSPPKMEMCVSSISSDETYKVDDYIVANFSFFAFDNNDNEFIKNFNKDYDDNPIKILKVIKTYKNGIVVTPKFLDVIDISDEKFHIYLPKAFISGSIKVDDSKINWIPLNPISNKRMFEEIFEHYFQFYLKIKDINVFDLVKIHGYEGEFEIISIWEKKNLYLGNPIFAFQFEGNISGTCQSSKISEIKHVEKETYPDKESIIPKETKIGHFKIKNYYEKGVIFQISTEEYSGEVFLNYAAIKFFMTQDGPINGSLGPLFFSVI